MKSQRLMGGQTTKFDRRGAERIAQTDAVEFSFENPVPVRIQASLIDVSHGISGFARLRGSGAEDNRSL
jgi:hypothetical protein